MVVGTHLSNGASSGQSGTSSDQSSSAVRNPTSIDTTLAVASNVGHGTTPKTSNISDPTAEGKYLDVVQQFTEEMGPFAHGRIVGVPNTKKGINYYTIEYDKETL
eukprot:14552058-Ditylum_brightwellii.AAC.1